MSVTGILEQILLLMIVFLLGWYAAHIARLWIKRTRHPHQLDAQSEWMRNNLLNTAERMKREKHRHDKLS